MRARIRSLKRLALSIFPRLRGYRMKSTSTKEFGLWRELDRRDEADRVRLAAFLTEFAEMADARHRMVESPSQLKKGGLRLHDDMGPNTVRMLLEFLERSRGLIDVKSFKNILHQAHVVISGEPNISLIPNPKPGEHVTIIGDLHGDLDDLLMILEKVGFPSSDHRMIFNGDFVDRGQHGVEVLAFLLALKVVFPDHVFLNRGNHEDSSICRAYGFYDEIMAKYSSPRLYDEITQVFASLPLCAIIRDRAFIVHGGIPREEGTTIHHIGGIARRTHLQTFCTAADRGKVGAHSSRQLIEDMMWSDPDPYVRGQAKKTSRGAGFRYGPDTVQKWLEALGSESLKTLVRSHECVENGYDMIDCGDGYKLWTVFSASNYAGGWNKGAVLRFGSSGDPEPITYETSYSGERESKQKRRHKKLVELICKYQPHLERQFEKIAVNNKITVNQWEEILFLELGLSIKYNVFLNPEDAEEDRIVHNSSIDYKAFFHHCQEQNSSVHQHSQALSAIFGLLDENGDGVVTYEEFKRGCELLNHRLPAAQQFDANELFRFLDKNESGEVELSELNEAMTRETSQPQEPFESTN
ncbi:hypothetical protein AAMO2058_001598900 [Amorphochlora amoebiformis]